MFDFKIVDQTRTLLNLFKASDKQLSRAFQNGLKKVMRVIRKDAVASLKGKVKDVSKHNPKYTDTLVKGVRMTRTWENKQAGKEGVAGRVSIASTGQKGSGSFRLQILEQGSYKVGGRYRKKKYQTRSEAEERMMSKRRKTGRKGYTGVLKAYQFFRPIVTNMSKYNSMLSKEIEAALQRKFGVNVK